MTDLLLLTIVLTLAAYVLRHYQRGQERRGVEVWL